MNNKVAVFVVTHSDDLIKYYNDAIIPILTGAVNKTNNRGYQDSSLNFVSGFLILCQN